MSIFTKAFLKNKRKVTEQLLKELKEAYPLYEIVIQGAKPNPLDIDFTIRGVSIDDRWTAEEGAYNIVNPVHWGTDFNLGVDIETTKEIK